MDRKQVKCEVIEKKASHGASDGRCQTIRFCFKVLHVAWPQPQPKCRTMAQNSIKTVKIQCLRKYMSELNKNSECFLMCLLMI